MQPRGHRLRYFREKLGQLYLGLCAVVKQQPLRNVRARQRCMDVLQCCSLTDLFLIGIDGIFWIPFEFVLLLVRISTGYMAVMTGCIQEDSRLRNPCKRKEYYPPGVIIF